MAERKVGAVGMDLIACDPGVEYFGWAQFDGSSNRLVDCGRWFNPDLITWPFWLDCTSPRAFHIVCEDQVGSKSDKATRANILGLARMTGALVSRSAKPPKLYSPVQWKGTVPRNTSHKLVLKTLEPSEFLIYINCVKGLHVGMCKDVSHAIGVGLYHLRRYFP